MLGTLTLATVMQKKGPISSVYASPTPLPIAALHLNPLKHRPFTSTLTSKLFIRHSHTLALTTLLILYPLKPIALSFLPTLMLAAPTFL